MIDDLKEEGKHMATPGNTTSAASEARRGKQSQFAQDRPAGGGDGGDRCRRPWAPARQTKPISARASGEANTLQEKSYGKLDRHMALEKQSQFPPERRQARLPVPLSAPIAPKKANSPRTGRQAAATGVAGAGAPGHQRAKQSQFPPGHPDGQRPYR
jgi:hypothetical protein